MISFTTLLQLLQTSAAVRASTTIKKYKILKKTIKYKPLIVASKKKRGAINKICSVFGQSTNMCFASVCILDLEKHILQTACHIIFIGFPIFWIPFSRNIKKTYCFVANSEKRQMYSNTPSKQVDIHSSLFREKSKAE